MKNRNLRTLIIPVAVGALCVALGGHAFADDTNAIAVVKVGDAGNKDDGTGFGAVAYEYKIGKYEVTSRAGFSSSEHFPFVSSRPSTHPIVNLPGWIVTISGNDGEMPTFQNGLMKM